MSQDLYKKFQEAKRAADFPKPGEDREELRRTREKAKEALEKKFERDRAIIEDLCVYKNVAGSLNSWANVDEYDGCNLKDLEGHFVEIHYGNDKRWKYTGAWTFLDFREGALVLLIGLELAQKFLYGQDQLTACGLSERILATLPQYLHNKMKTLIAGIEFEKSLLGLAQTDDDTAEPAMCDKYLKMFLHAIHAKKQKRYLSLRYESPYHGPFTYLFLPKQVFFINHDWYCVGLEIDYEKGADGFNDDNAHVMMLRLSRIQWMHPALEECALKELPDAANSFADEEHFPLKEVMDCVYKGNYYFPLSTVTNCPKAEVQLKFTGTAVDSVQRIQPMYGGKKSEPYKTEVISPDGKHEQKDCIDYTAEVTLLDKDGAPKLKENNTLKMAIFNKLDSVTVLGPRKVQEDAIAIAQGFIDRTRAAMNQPEQKAEPVAKNSAKGRANKKPGSSGKKPQ